MGLQNENSLTDQIVSVAASIATIPDEEVENRLITLINELINKDLPSLIHLLYRIDVDEKRIRTNLHQNKNKDSASILANLIIERQLQKNESKERFKNTKSDESKEEKW